MSRGHGRMMCAIIHALRAASGPLAFGEMAIDIYGSRTVTRQRRGRRRGVVVPAGDTSNLRRALRGLVRRGDVVVVDRDASTYRRGARYGLSDLFTGNGDGLAGASFIPSSAPATYLDAVSTPTTGGSVCEQRGHRMCATAAGNVTTAASHLNEKIAVVPATTLVARGNPANDVVAASGADEPPNDTMGGVANPTTRRVRSRSGESSSSSARLTSAGVPSMSVRGGLPVPAKVFPWERPLLTSLVDELLQELSHANKNDNSDS